MQARSLGIAGKVCRHSGHRKQGRHNTLSKLIKMSRLGRLSERSTGSRPGASVACFGGINNFWMGAK